MLRSWPLPCRHHKRFHSETGRCPADRSSVRMAAARTSRRISPSPALDHESCCPWLRTRGSMSTCDRCRCSVPPLHTSPCHRLRHPAAPPQHPTSAGCARHRWLHSICTCHCSKEHCLRRDDSPPSSVPLRIPNANLVEYDGGPASFVVPFVTVSCLAARVGHDFLPCLLIFVAQPTLVPRPGGRGSREVRSNPVSFF